MKDLNIIVYTMKKRKQIKPVIQPLSLTNISTGQ